MSRFGMLLRCAVAAAALLCLGAASASANSMPAGMSWSGDMSTGDFSQYSFLEQCPGDIASVVGNPAPAGVHAVQLKVSDGDTQSACPGKVFTPNPAASMIGPTVFHNGDDAWMGFSVYLPAGFPTIPTWFQFAEVYGPPFGGSPPIGLDIEGNRMGLWRDATHNFDNPWSTPVVTGQWQDIVLHVKFSPDPTVGFVELYFNGVQQQFADGSTRLYYSTLVPGNNWDGASGGNYLDIDQYRSHLDQLGTVTVYDAEMAIGDSYAAVAPQLHYGIASAPTASPAPPPATVRPAPRPTPKPATKPATTPATKPATKPATTPAPKPAPHVGAHSSRVRKHRKHVRRQHAPHYQRPWAWTWLHMLGFDF